MTADYSEDELHCYDDSISTGGTSSTFPAYVFGVKGLFSLAGSRYEITLSNEHGAEFVVETGFRPLMRTCERWRLIGTLALVTIAGQAGCYVLVGIQPIPPDDSPS